MAQKHRDDWLQTLLFHDKLQGRLLGIQRDARAVENETGVSTLHLAFGFLEWFEAEASEVAFSTPLLLLPVGLERVAARGREDEFWLAAQENEPVTNLSLELRLREERLSLPAFDQDSSDPIENYLGAVSEAIKRFPRWRIRRFLTLAPFSFARIAMYRDLAPENWSSLKGGPTAHPLVRPLIRGSDEVFASTDSTFAEEYETDRPEIERIAPILVHDADSSQHSAIIDAMQGRSLVIEGPPGTGKSQTIANLIANAIYQGRTVLFVSEKMAALDVVKSRLDRVGLGHFCLALHAAGAKPATVMEALRRRLAFRPEPIPSDAGTQAQIQRACSELANHLAAMHSNVGPDQETVHVLIGRMVELGRLLPQLPSVLRPKGADIPFPIDAAGVWVARESLELFEAALSEPSHPGWQPAASPFRALRRVDLFPDEQETLLALLSQLVSDCAALESEWEQLAGQLGGNLSCSLREMLDTAERVARIGAPPAAADRQLISMLGAPGAPALGSQLAAVMVEAQELARTLSACGVREPRPDRLAEVARAVNELGLAANRLVDVAELCKEACARVNELCEGTETVSALAELFGLGADPQLEAVRLACTAAEIAAGLGVAGAPFRRPGLEHHVSLLESAALRQEEIDRRLRDVSELIHVTGLPAGALRRAAMALRQAGPFAFLTSEFREAKRLFVAHWREGPLPPRARWAGHLDAAATVLAEVASLQGDSRLRDVIGKEHGPDEIRFREFATAARWQGQALIRLSNRGSTGAALHAALVILDGSLLESLSGLAARAASVLDTLTRPEVPDRASWSSVVQSATTRQKALDELARALTEVGISEEVELGRLSELAEAAVRLQSLEVEMASLSTQLTMRPPLPDPHSFGAAVEFASAVQAEFPQAAPALLRDGWTSAIKAVRDSTASVVANLEKVQQALTRLKPLGLDALTTAAKAMTPFEVRTSASPMIEARDDLSAYLRYASARLRCVQDPFASVVLNAFEEAGSTYEHLPEALDWLLAWAVVRRCSEANRSVFTRSGAELSALRNAFARADRQRLQSDAKKVAARARQRIIPHGINWGSRKEWTDGALLQNELGKQRRHIPVRDLLARASQAIMALTPCLMMSPLTVAQYLQPGRTVFDLIIMDEASQVKPEDAVGALLRGLRTVIVGDPKQLPPTNFFDRALDDLDADDEDETDSQISADDRVSAESVLDLAMRAFQPVRRLRWHYRSQHESLIAFSNRQFYDHALVVFPAREEPSQTLGIELVQVGGRWQDRVNEREAKEIARVVAGFTRDHHDLSCGIVAMNQPQRDFIQAEIDRLTAGDSDYVAYREHWEERLEPPFVKNLENVQGDERDVIFVSLGWGRTPEGALHQRFSP